jgi:hypothetical protein
VRWGEEAEEGETWGRMAEFLFRASGISLSTSGVGLAQLRTSWHGEAGGRKKDNARRRAKLLRECWIFWQ